RLYDRLRAMGPAVLLEGREVWLVTGYDAVRSVLRHPGRFVSGLGTSYVRVSDSGLRAPFIDNDAPAHTRIRRSVQRWFTPSAMEAQRLQVRAHVEGLVSVALDPRPGHGGSVDGVAAFARTLPVLTIGLLTGIDHPDPAEVSALADSVFHVLGPEPAFEHLQRLGEGLGWLIGEGVPALPEHCLGRAMVDEGGDGGGLEADERLTALVSIWTAGVDTTTSLIANALHAFATHPDQWRMLREEPALAESAIEEVLRYASQIRMFMRRTLVATEVLGVAVPADADICALFPAANRDPAHYDDPDRFDVRRNPTDHLAFGSGLHLCLGAPAARMEGVELLRHLAARVRSIELDGAPTPNPSAVIQGFVTLPLRLTAA
ncbi:MAG: cytochrome P450, partial [Acidimicrobiales bacterium]